MNCTSWLPCYLENPHVIDLKLFVFSCLLVQVDSRFLCLHWCVAGTNFGWNTCPSSLFTFLCVATAIVFELVKFSGADASS